MLKTRVATVTVPYLHTDEHAILTENSYKTFPDTYRVVVPTHMPNRYNYISKYSNHKIVLKENCLSAAWNLGLMHVFEKGFEYAFVPNLDVLVKPWAVELALTHLEQHPTFGLVGLQAVNSLAQYAQIRSEPQGDIVDVVGDDQSFSAFIISKKCYEDVGGFDERFKPAYYEDTDYLRRLKLKGYTPKRATAAIFYHHVQASVKSDTPQNRLTYNKNLEYCKMQYIDKWGGLPGRETIHELH